MLMGRANMQTIFGFLVPFELLPPARPTLIAKDSVLDALFHFSFFLFSGSTCGIHSSTPCPLIHSPRSFRFLVLRFVSFVNWQCKRIIASQGGRR
jgi:hypothetical protein